MATDPNLDEFLGTGGEQPWKRYVRWGVAAAVVIVLLLVLKSCFGGTATGDYVTQAAEKGNLTVTVSATGNLTLHGTTRQVSFPLTVKRTTTSLAATGDITVTYSDYGIDNPSFGGFVSVGDTGTVEFLIVTTRA